MDAIEKNIGLLMRLIKVLVVDDEHYTRKVLRAQLTGMGVKQIFEAADGATGLAVIETVAPNIVLLDWEMPGMDGATFVRTVRTPRAFPYPDVPIIMLTGHGGRSRVVKAVRLGVHEYLLKPVSAQALQSRMVSVLAKPRPIVQRGDYYGPEPRKLTAFNRDDPVFTDIILAR